jgi:hypothetical protein
MVCLPVEGWLRVWAKLDSSLMIEALGAVQRPYR